MKDKYSTATDSGNYKIDEATQRTRIANEMAEINHHLQKQNDFLSLITYALSCKLGGAQMVRLQTTLKELQDRK